MKIVYGKNLSTAEKEIVGNIASECGILFDTARLMFYRGIDDVSKAKRFLNAGKSGFFDPYLLSDMKEAVQRIYTAKNRGERVLVFGDYDADGICATTVLYNCLKELGVSDLRVYVPEREEGYGLNVDTVLRLHSQLPIDLLITVDCGISDCDKIEELKKLGIDIVVTDHHEPPEVLPNCIKINPKLSGQDYPFDGLCGAGVAYKLGNALIGEKADKYLDFVAVATVADSMDLISENRDIVVEGLKIINDPRLQNMPLKYLLGDNKNATAQTLAYMVAPRINAGGRMGDAKTALDLFISTDINKAYDLSVKLNEYNIARQVRCDEIYNQAKDKIKKYSLEKRDVILVKDSAWQAGFVGIVAAKLVEDYARPVIVFAGQDGHLKGSARSIDQVNIHEAITASKDLLLGFGGHSQAAGVSVSEENFILLDKSLNAYVKNEYGKIDKDLKVFAEWNIEGAVSDRFVKEIDLLEPFGVGNRRPIFSTEVEETFALPLRQGSPHYSFKSDVMEMLDFNGQKDVYPLSLPVKKKVLFEINASTYKNKVSIKGYVRGVYPEYGDFSSLKTHILHNELQRLKEDGIGLDSLKKVSLKKDGVSTIYAVSNPENIQKYPELNNLKRYLFRPDAKTFSDCIVVSPKEIPDGYGRVVYLDKPLQPIKTDKESYILNDLNGYNLSGLSVDRSDFARIFNTLKSLDGKNFTDSVWFARRYKGLEREDNFLFVIEVFFELNIFCVKNGVFKYNEMVKNALTNSKLYSKIILLKENYV